MFSNSQSTVSVTNNHLPGDHQYFIHFHPFYSSVKTVKNDLHSSPLTKITPEMNQSECKPCICDEIGTILIVFQDAWTLQILRHLEVRINMRNWIVWVAHVKWGSFSNLYKATMPPATDGMMVEGEKINQSMNSMIYVMIRVIHIFSYRSAVRLRVRYAVWILVIAYN